MYSYIKANKEIGKDIIDTLKKVGGVNSHKYEGIADEGYYYISTTNVINYTNNPNEKVAIEKNCKEIILPINHKFNKEDKVVIIAGSSKGKILDIHPGDFDTDEVMYTVLTNNNYVGIYKESELKLIGIKDTKFKIDDWVIVNYSNKIGLVKYIKEEKDHIYYGVLINNDIVEYYTEEDLTNFYDVYYPMKEVSYHGKNASILDFSYAKTSTKIIFINSDIPAFWVNTKDIKERIDVSWKPKRGDLVLVKFAPDDIWEEAVFSFDNSKNNKLYPYHTVNGGVWAYCIEFDISKLGKATKN